MRTLVEVRIKLEDVRKLKEGKAVPAVSENACKEILAATVKLQIPIEDFQDESGLFPGEFSLKYAAREQMMPSKPLLFAVPPPRES